ncbi:DUF2071 domain-containing protein [bacterium]|nr:DUF2071 domain-containing protein [bacterium]
MSEIVLLANFVASAVMTGVIWFVQWVHYPLLATVPVDRAVETAVEHQRRTGQVLAFPMATEGVTTLWLLRILPDGLEVDVCDGSAWVGLIPFSMRGIGVPGLPAVPYFGSFAEINVRTYVRRNGVPGVWFCSLDINRLLPTIVARTTYTLPYCFGRASNRRVGEELHTMVERRWPRGDRSANTNIHLRIGEPIVAPSPLEIFLSARWGLYTTTAYFLAIFQTPHEKTPRQKIDCAKLHFRRTATTRVVH